MSAALALRLDPFCVRSLFSTKIILITSHTFRIALVHLFISRSLIFKAQRECGWCSWRKGVVNGDVKPCVCTLLFGIFSGFGFSLYRIATTFYAKSFIIYRCWMPFFIFCALPLAFCVCLRVYAYIFLCFCPRLHRWRHTYTLCISLCLATRNILKNLASVCFWHNQIHFLHNFQLLVHFSLWTKLTWLLVVDWMYSVHRHTHTLTWFSPVLFFTYSPYTRHQFPVKRCVVATNIKRTRSWHYNHATFTHTQTHTLTTRMYRMQWQCVNKGMCQRLGTRLGIYVSWATYENKSKRANG